MTNDDLRLAERLAAAAGAAIRPYFRAACSHETKADASPVTEADRAAEAAMRQILAVERPNDGIIGEEFGAERADARRVWVLDPIDGTRSFMTGRPSFGTLIALLEEAQPVLGLIDQPIVGERWIGAVGQATRFNGAPARVRNCPDLGQAQLATTSPYLFSDAGLNSFEAVRMGVANTIVGGDCYNYALLSIGQLDLVIEEGLKLYDFAALVPVVAGAGGVMCDWQGQPLDQHSDGRVIALGDPTLLTQIVQMIGRA
jgi:inositol-phosphate phosphatase / L-galactose 1-phosphate phosphatase / histidinol-phosphatase